MSETPESAFVSLPAGEDQASLWALKSAETQAELVFETLPEKQAAPQIEQPTEIGKPEPAPATQVQPHIERRAEPRFESRAASFLDAQFQREAETPAEVQLEVLTGRPEVVHVEPPVGTELDGARFETPTDPLLETRPEAHVGPPSFLQNEADTEAPPAAVEIAANALTHTPAGKSIPTQMGAREGAELEAQDDTKVEEQFVSKTGTPLPPPAVPQIEASVAPKAEALLETRPVVQVDPQADVLLDPEIETEIKTKIETPIEAHVEIQPAPPVETQAAIKPEQSAEQLAENAPERGIEKQLEAPVEKRAQTQGDKQKVKAEAPTLAPNDRPFRVKLRGSVLVLIKLPNKRQLRAALHQLSTSGGVINLEKPLDEKIEVELIFHIDRSTIHGKAQMLFPMWATQGWMQPFRFVEMSDTDRDALKDNLQSFIGNMAKGASANG
jgi:hypothetical protein